MNVRAIMLSLAIGVGLAAGSDAFSSAVSLQGEDARQISLLTPDSAAASSQEAITSLRGGWTDFAPFQSLSKGGIEGAEGLDVEILSDVVRAAGMEAQLHKQNWQDQLRSLEEGRSDIAIGAFLPADGDDRFHYSLPYRWARVSLYVRKSDKEVYKNADVHTLLSEAPAFRLGVIPGRLFQDPKLNESVKRAEQAGRVKYAQSDKENLKNLLSGEIDGFIDDRLGVTATALELGQKYEAFEIVLPGTSGVHFIFSKKTVPAETVEKINGAITKLEEDGVLKKHLHMRIFSVIMSYALDSHAFLVLSVVGTIAFALSGVLIAYRENFSFFGALVLAALPAVGGGALRDILFNRHPIGIMLDPLSLYLVGATVLTGFCVAAAVRYVSARSGSHASPPKTRRWLTMTNAQEVCDAAGMAAFTVSGLAIAITFGPDPLWVWGPISAMLSAAGGGILRDIVRQAGKVGSLKDEFYAEVPLLWGLAFSVFLLSRPNILTPEEVVIAIAVASLGTFVTRMAVVIFGWQAPPFRWPRN